MAKHISQEEWIKWFKRYRESKTIEGWKTFWNEFSLPSNAETMRIVKIRFNKITQNE